MLQFFRQNLGGVSWFIASVAGIAALCLYSQQPGGLGEAPELWPEQSLLVAEEAGLQLVMFVHPQCPCSRASLGELAVLMRNCQVGLSARVLFISPKGQSEEWLHSSLWHQAEQIPHVMVEVDYDGVEAARFGAETSGVTLVYGEAGQLVFHGGITAARGHYGDNVGRIAIQQLTNGHDAEGQTTVFGCPLYGEQCVDEALHTM